MRTIAVSTKGLRQNQSFRQSAKRFGWRGYRTLLMDMDPQGHCAVGLQCWKNKLSKDRRCSHRDGSRRTDAASLHTWQTAPVRAGAVEHGFGNSLHMQMNGVKEMENCRHWCCSGRDDYKVSTARRHRSADVQCPGKWAAIIVPGRNGPFFAVWAQAASGNTQQPLPQQQKLMMVLASIHIRTKMASPLAELKADLPGADAPKPY